MTISWSFRKTSTPSNYARKIDVPFLWIFVDVVLSLGWLFFLKKKLKI
jgi:hypothetical protein